MADTFASISAHETFTFRVDPYSMTWSHNLRTKVESTYGGKVWQILGTDLGVLSIDLVAGMGGREYIRKIQKFWIEMQLWQQDLGKTALFSFPYKGYRLKVLAGNFTFEDSVTNVVMPFNLQFNIQQDLGGQLKKSVMTDALSKLNDGVGYTLNKYNKPSLDLSTIPEPVSNNAGTTTPGTTTGGPAGTINAADLSSEQQANAQTIVNVAYGLSLSDEDKYKAAVIGVMTAITESTLKNVAHGDAMGPSSKGLFQQMPQYWGPAADIMNPAKSAQMFFTGGVDDGGGQGSTPGLLDKAGWQTQDPWVAAQSVQGSEFSDGSNYKGNYDWAKRIVVAGTGNSTLVTGVSVTIPAHADVAPEVHGKTITAPNAAVAAGIAAGLNYLGTPYVWGGGTNQGPPDNGESRGGGNFNSGGSLVGFDCSGLTGYVLKQAGITVPTNSSGQRMGSGVVDVPYGQGKPGDLVGYSGHIAVFLGNIGGQNYLLEAPTEGKNVSIRTVYDVNGGIPRDSNLHRWWK